MKVLLCHRPGGAFGYITDSIINALRDKGHKVQRWDGNASSWEQFDPDLYIGSVGHKQPIPTDTRAKIALHVNPYGPSSIPGIDETKENIEWIRSHKVDVVWGYGHETDAHFWEYWNSRLGIRWTPFATAGDKTLYHDKGTDRSIDVVYLGGRWQYKGITIDAYLLPVLKKYHAKVHGWGDWPEGISGGILEEDKVCDFFNSGKVAPCISEKHTHDYGIDIPERAFKVALCGTLVIHDNTKAIKKFMPSAVVASSPKEFLDMVGYYINNDGARKSLIDKQKSEVLNANTYHHRVSGLLKSVGFIAEAEHILS